MDCHRHLGVVSTAVCVACAQPICAECQEEVAGHAMCRPCVAAAQARLSSGPGAAVPSEAGAAGVLASGAATSAAADAEGTEPPAATQPAFDQPASAPKDYVRAGIGRRLVRGLLWG